MNWAADVCRPVGILFFGEGTMTRYLMCAALFVAAMTYPCMATDSNAPQVKEQPTQAQTATQAQTGAQAQTATQAQTGAQPNVLNTTAPELRTAPSAGHVAANSAAGLTSTKRLSRQEIRSMPILERPNRPGHFYGNTVRRRNSR